MCCTSSVGTACWQASSTAAGISDMYTLFTSSLPGLSSGRYVSISFRMSFFDSTGLALPLALLCSWVLFAVAWPLDDEIVDEDDEDDDDDSEEAVWDEDDTQDTPDVDEQDEELVEDRSKVEFFFSESE